MFSNVLKCVWTVLRVVGVMLKGLGRCLGARLALCSRVLRALALFHSLRYLLMLIGDFLETCSTFGGHVYSPLRAPIGLDLIRLKGFP